MLRKTQDAAHIEIRDYYVRELGGDFLLKHDSINTLIVLTEPGVGTNN